MGVFDVIMHAIPVPSGATVQHQVNQRERTFQHRKLLPGGNVLLALLSVGSYERLIDDSFAIDRYQLAGGVAIARHRANEELRAAAGATALDDVF